MLFCNFLDNGVETNDSYLAACFIVFGGKFIEAKIKGLNVQMEFILKGIGNEKINIADVEDVNAFIKAKGYNLIGVKLPLKMPKIIYQIIGDVKKFKEIINAMKNGNDVIGNKSKEIIDKTKELKNIAYKEVQTFYENMVDTNGLKSIEGVEIE